MAEELLKDLNLSVRVIKKEEINFGFDCIIGSGGYGTVFKARWCNTDVAVKSIRFAFKEKYMKREILTMSQIRHPNFVSIMAVAIDYTKCHIVMDLFKNSVNMRDLLFKEEIIDEFKLSHEDKIHLATQMSAAISYLHNDDLLIIHEDIKPENVLVNGILDLKVCDMGLSRSNRMSKDLLTTDGRYDRGTPMYTAPELTSCISPASKYSDVWAVGCVLIELFTSNLVWDAFASEKLLVVYQEKKLPKGIDKIDCVKLQKILKSCFSYNPESRPDINIIHKYFYKTQMKLECEKEGKTFYDDSDEAD